MMLFTAQNEVLEKFRDGAATFCVEKHGALVYEEYGRGIGPALSAYTSQKALLEGACVYDTIVGKAAASLFVLAKVRAVYGETMSELAAALLESHGIAVRYAVLTGQIINRRGDGLCPFEQAVLSCSTAEECLPVIRRTMQTLKSASQTASAPPLDE